ncbi:ABC transporter permease [Streptomyces mirabilis]|uniref:ABC transporter permease n=1 Tax=Streptomyces mirabilis TaxID=68239 RepID=UPI0036810C99
MLLYGTELRSVLLLVVYASFWQVLVQVLYGVQDVDPVAEETARSYGLGPWARVRRAVCEPVLEFLRAVPPPVLVPVIMLFAGIGDTMKIAVIASGCVWPILLNTVEGVRAVDSVMAETARSYGVTGVARLRSVVLRAASPQIFAGLRQTLSIGIILMVISEMFAASNGLGFTVVQFQRSFAIPDMWTGILVLGLLGFLLSVVFQLVERRVLGWYHGLRAVSRRSP